MEAKIQISLDHLKKIIYNAETRKKTDNSLSSTLVFELEHGAKLFNDSDDIRVTLKSNYQECNGIEIW
jgi:hypothetical protein